MQDNYIGDIGDYGKYGLLREIYAADMSLSVNWYRVVPTKIGKQDDGKYINYGRHRHAKTLSAANGVAIQRGSHKDTLQNEALVSSVTRK